MNPFIHDEHIIVDSEKAKKNLQFYLKHENERNHNLILNYKNKIYMRDFKQIKTIDKRNPTNPKSIVLGSYHEVIHYLFEYYLQQKIPLGNQFVY